MGLYFCLDLSKLTNLLLPVRLIGEVMKYAGKINRRKNAICGPIFSSQNVLILRENTNGQFEKKKNELRLFMHHLVFRTLN